MRIELVNRIDAAVESLLFQMDTTLLLIEKVHNDQTFSLEYMLPALLEKLKTLEPVFDRVDRLEALVKRLGERVDGVESALERAETEMRPPSAAPAKAFRDFFGRITGSITPPTSQTPTVLLIRPSPSVPVFAAYTTPHTRALHVSSCLSFPRVQGPGWQQVLSNNLFAADEFFEARPTRVEASPEAPVASTPLASDSHMHRSAFDEATAATHVSDTSGSLATNEPTGSSNTPLAQLPNT
jgi:hypothetical protein